MLNGLLPGSTWQEITCPVDIGDALASIVNGYGQLIGRPTSCSPHRKVAYAFCNIEAVLAGESVLNNLRGVVNKETPRERRIRVRDLLASMCRTKRRFVAKAWVRVMRSRLCRSDLAARETARKDASGTTKIIQGLVARGKFS
jgi:hypothetical protein